VNKTIYEKNARKSSKKKLKKGIPFFLKLLENKNDIKLNPTKI
jgi:hypothetical protein